ncbi:unnamed protein product [Tenebrio molitor]|nr:unnamed protein product [Tenebrio molitor]
MKMRFLTIALIVSGVVVCVLAGIPHGPKWRQRMDEDPGPSDNSQTHLTRNVRNLEGEHPFDIFVRFAYDYWKAKTIQRRDQNVSSTCT